MRSSSPWHSLFLVFVILLLSLTVVVHVYGRQIYKNDGLKNQATETITIEAAALKWYARRPRHPSTTKRKTNKKAANHDHETVQIAGSRLPDCSHACGSCSPCRLVMISFVCASLEEAETCPMAYKCMCRSKSYPVP
ncbi:hypothetical protein LUZ61_008760 [Rhynchospora tenuis]|uniref:Epidermal patterning factor-like protein n=1 Tax=Rhynchospora tenuis TaxID=198213 RepID=A0AAD6EXX5_9POAL|nr:hypothetical protein LUZ61_008760 [Rhynchospora tenuis]